MNTVMKTAFFPDHEISVEETAGPQKPSICIVSHNAYGAICGGKTGFIGGVERQTSLLSCWLADNGFGVTLVTWDEGGPTEETIGGVKVLKICRKDAGLPGLRFFHPKWTSLSASLRRADADVYYHNCGDCVTGQVAMWCKRNRRAFVFSSASEGDCEYPHRGLKSWREQILFRYGIRRAEIRVVQTLRQKQMFEENFGLSSVQIPMPCQEFVLPGRVRVRPQSNRVLWVGRVWMEKRPQLFLDLAEACPQLHFDLVGPGFNAGEYGHSFSDDIFQRAKSIPNVMVHGPLPREEVFKLYDEAACLCCTSEYEGFPNTFLEAWSRGLPVISTFDPDGTIASWRLGASGRDVGELTAALLSLINDDECYREVSANARRYFVDFHTVDAVLPQFAQVFLAAARGMVPELPGCSAMPGLVDHSTSTFE